MSNRLMGISTFRFCPVKTLGRISLFAILIIVGHLISCETENLTYEWDCYECFSIKPDSANLIVYLTINSENESVPLIIYKGPVEHRIIDWQDTATTDEYLLYAEVGIEYSIQATYWRGNETIYAYDGDLMTLSDQDRKCGTPCYIVEGGIFDLTLGE